MQKVRQCLFQIYYNIREHFEIIAQVIIITHVGNNETRRFKVFGAALECPHRRRALERDNTTVTHCANSDDRVKFIYFDKILYLLM